MFHTNHSLALLIGALNAILFTAGAGVFVWAARGRLRERGQVAGKAPQTGGVQAISEPE